MELAYKICAGGNSYCCDYCLLYLIWAGNNEMRPLGYHPPHLVDNADTLYLGNQHWQQTVFFLYSFISFVFISLPQSVCLNHFFCGSLYNPSLCNPVSKNFLLWGCHWPLKEKMIKTQWLTLGEWDCPCDNDPKLVMGQPIADKK